MSSAGDNFRFCFSTALPEGNNSEESQRLNDGYRASDQPSSRGKGEDKEAAGAAAKKERFCSRQILQETERTGEPRGEYDETSA